jgi:type II secretory pathway component GspD/PulD (secretin)
LGLAFLSDIQVFMFMEAAQGDQRTNVMQAPKITMFNGQTSTITVMDQQFFVTNVQVVPQNGQLTFLPQVQNLSQGTSLTVQAVISADRRFVRMSLTPTLTNLASAVVPLFPIVTPVQTFFEGGFNGPPVTFTQFLQQPVVDTIAVLTTVSVPDGGTVLMGGLKRLSEGRNEFGPPVLSKIPYINRLFKNVGYGREAESLMIMVTPRIIINEEEEIRATGVVTAPPQ